LGHLATRLETVFHGMSPFKKGVLALALAAFVVEVVFRVLAPKSKAYARWTEGLEAVGSFWTAILLSVVYFVTVALANLGFRLSGRDPLDRSLRSEATFWRLHEANPLGPMKAARHQF
jgi:hypothetical protein